jgi:hypothetical protein
MRPPKSMIGKNLFARTFFTPSALPARVIGRAREVPR